MKEWVTVLRAADVAARWHVNQRRNGPAPEEEEWCRQGRPIVVDPLVLRW